MPDSFASQQNQTPAPQSPPAPPTSPGANLPTQTKSSPAAVQPIQPISGSQPDQTGNQSQTVLPKEQSVEEIENELLVGAAPGQKKSGVVAGQSASSEAGTRPQATVVPQEFQEEPKAREELKPASTPAPMAPTKEKPASISDEASVKAKADADNLPYVNLVGFAISPETLKIIPEKIAKKYQVIPYLKVNNQIKLGAIDPKNKEMIEKISEVLADQNLEPLYAYCSQASVKYALKNYRFVGEKEKPKTTADSEKDDMAKGDLAVSGRKTAFKKEIKGFINLRNEISKVPTTKLFDVLVSGAIKENASDIHIEPGKKEMRIRYRIDGILQDIVNLPQEAYQSLASRIKFLAKMKLDLKNLPQDGRFTIHAGDKNIDLRISTLPTVYGEGIVLRLLLQEKKFLSLKDLGFNQKTQEMIEESISKPTGMILNTGPTGSGKTTTLYAILDKLNKPGVKIITLEDPVEYRIPGIIQSQVDAYAKYSFARGLRSILRQDPDIVLVGEIRDLETARIALNAAMTGHLVLSTLHTNNATSAPSRLLEIGVKPFLVAGNINLIIAQRLVRRLCDKCKKKYKPRPGIVEAIKRIIPMAEIPTYLWNTGHCSVCQGTGFSGRIPVIEAFKPTSRIEKMVLESTPAAKIREASIAAGMKTMEQDGIEKVFEGITTIQEVWRVTKE
jgi:type II secretory ATPase GspE/PulE/Tfp pilus assembly ATPase PilB-like protein